MHGTRQHPPPSSPALGTRSISLFDSSFERFERSYASFDYEPAGYQPADIVRLDILLNGEAVDALSRWVSVGAGCWVHGWVFGCLVPLYPAGGGGRVGLGLRLGLV